MYGFFNNVFFNLFFIFYITSRLHHTHHTPLWRERQPRKPTKAPAANKGRRRPTKREKGPNDASGVVWAIGKFFLKCIFSKCTTYPPKPTKAHSSQRRPMQAHEDGKWPKRRRGTCFFYCTFYFLFFILPAGCTTPTTPLFGMNDSHESPRRPQQPTKADAGPQRGKRAQTTRLASFGP